MTKGGYRPGSGRKRTDLRRRVTVLVSEAEWDRWLGLAKAAGLTVSAWIRGAVKEK